MKFLFIFSVVVVAAALTGCASQHYKASTFGADWTPPSYVKPELAKANGKTGITASGFFNTGIRIVSPASTAGARIGIDTVWGQAFSPVFGWNLGGGITGFVADTVPSEVPDPSDFRTMKPNTQSYLSYGGTAQISASFILGKPEGVTFQIGPDLLFSIERGPWYDMRAEIESQALPANVTATSTQFYPKYFNNSANGISLSGLVMLRANVPIVDAEYLSWGAGWGIVHYPDEADITWGSYNPIIGAFLSYQAEQIRVFARILITAYSLQGYMTTGDQTAVGVIPSAGVELYF